jgi:hypothetical protein
MPELNEPEYKIIQTTKQVDDTDKKKYKFLDDIIDTTFIKKYLQTIKIK